MFLILDRRSSTAQNSCVPSVSKILGSNQTTPDTSKFTTKTRAREYRLGLLFVEGVGRAESGRLGPCDSWTKVPGFRDNNKASSYFLGFMGQLFYLFAFRPLLSRMNYPLIIAFIDDIDGATVFLPYVA